MLSSRGRAYVASKPPGTPSYDFQPVNSSTTKSAAHQDRATSVSESNQSGQTKINMRRSPTNIKTNPKYGIKKSSPDSSIGSDGSGGKKRIRPRSLVILGTAQSNRKTNSSHSDLTTKEAPVTGKDISPIHPKAAHEMDPCLILSTPELRRRCAQGLTSPDMSDYRKPSRPKNRSSSLDALQRSHECFKLGGKECCKCTIPIYKAESVADISKNKKNQSNYDSRRNTQEKKYPEGKNYPYVFIGRDRGDGLVEKIGLAKRDENGIATKTVDKSPNSVGLRKIDLNMTLPYYIANGLPRSRESVPPVTLTPVKPRQKEVNGKSTISPTIPTLSNSPSRTRNRSSAGKPGSATRHANSSPPRIIIGDTESTPLSESQVSSFFKPSPTVWSTPVSRGPADKQKRDITQDYNKTQDDKKGEPSKQMGPEKIAPKHQPRLGDLDQTVPRLRSKLVEPEEIMPVYQPRLGDLEQTVPKLQSKPVDEDMIVPKYQPQQDDLDQTIQKLPHEPVEPDQIVPVYQPNLGDLEQTLPKRRMERQTTRDHQDVRNVQKVNEGAMESTVDHTNGTPPGIGAQDQNNELEKRNNRINLMPSRLSDSKFSDQNLVIKGYTPPEKERSSKKPTTTSLKDTANIPSSSKQPIAASSKQPISTTTCLKDPANIPNQKDSCEDSSQKGLPNTDEHMNNQKGSAMPVDKYLSLQKDVPKYVQSEIAIDSSLAKDEPSTSPGDTSSSWPRKRPSTPTNKRVSGFQYDSEEDKIIVQNLLARYAAHGSLATSGLSRAELTDYLNTVKKQLGLNETPENSGSGKTNDANENISALKSIEKPSKSETDTKEKEKRVLEKEDIDVFSQTTFHVDGEITNSPVVRRRVLVAELGKKKSSSSALDDDENNNDGGCGPVYSAAKDDNKTCKGIRSGDVVYSRDIPTFDLWTKSGGFQEDEDIPEDLLELGITDDQFSSMIPSLNECILCKQLDITLDTWLSGCYFAAIFLLLWVIGFVVCYLGDMAGIAPGLVFVVAILLVLTIAGSFQLTKRLTSSKYQSSLLAVNRELRAHDVMVSVRRSGPLGTGLSVHFVFFDILPCQKILLLSVKDKAAENKLLTQISEKHPALMDIIARDLRGVSTKPATVGRKIILSDILVYFAPSFLDEFLAKKRLAAGKVYFGGLRGSTLELCEFVRGQGLGDILKGVSGKHTPQTVSHIKQPSSLAGTSLK